jgi:hypothetical protein
VSKRDYIKEILSQRERLTGQRTRVSLFDEKAFLLNGGFLFMSDSKEAEYYRDEYLKYMPIGFVAAMEAYFRLAYRDLIDFGPPFSENLKSFSEIKFQIETVLAMTSKTISIGEFIAHLLPFKSLANINENMSHLIGEDFLSRLKKTKITVLRGAKPVTMDNYHSEIPSAISKIFQMRHVFCHEFATDKKLNLQEIRDYSYASYIFILATESLLKELKVFPKKLSE